MSAEDKAKKFASAGDQHGWTSKIELRDDEAHVSCARSGEEIYIWWRGNSLVETPKYTFNGHTTSTHNAAGAYRQLQAKPDLNRAYRRSKRVAVASSNEYDPQNIVRQPLPFDIYESSDKEILREIRGSRITWLNRMTGLAESSLVPYRVSRNGVPALMNTDLDNVFYLAEGKDERAYLSFMDNEGRFRAVYLDNILAVSG